MPILNSTSTFPLKSRLAQTKVGCPKLPSQTSSQMTSHQQTRTKSSAVTCPAKNMNSLTVSRHQMLLQPYQKRASHPTTTTSQLTTIPTVLTILAWKPLCQTVSRQTPTSHHPATKRVSPPLTPPPPTTSPTRTKA